MLGSVGKRRMVNKWLWKVKRNIIFIQEHRLDEHGIALFRLTHPNMECFATCKNRGAGGAAILARNEWCPKLALAHPLGQAMEMEFSREGRSWVTISTYVPNLRLEREALWAWLLPRVEGRDILLCGDLNRGDEEQLKSWSNLADALCLVDVAMQCNGKGNTSYTWSRIKQDGTRELSRLDKIYASGEGFWVNPPLRFCTNYAPVCFDHVPIDLTWNLKDTIRRKGHSVFKLNVAHLRDKRFMQEVRSVGNIRFHRIQLINLIMPQHWSCMQQVDLAKRGRGKQGKKERLVPEIVRLRLTGVGENSVQDNCRLRELEVQLNKLDSVCISATDIQAGIGVRDLAGA